MSIKVSDVFSGLVSQQIPALITILNKASEHAREVGISDGELLSTRLQEDMHPLSWQLQTTVELIQRGVSRLLRHEPENLVLNQDNFGDLINTIESIRGELSKLDSVALDETAEQMFDIPVGPDASLTLTGQDYVLKFLLPNIYFHLTMSYGLLRMKGVPLGKRDFMGPF